jgi:hypothetical protein
MPVASEGERVVDVGDECKARNLKIPHGQNLLADPTAGCSEICGRSSLLRPEVGMQPQA